MGSDQAEGILTTGGNPPPLSSSSRSLNNHSDALECNCPAATSGGCCPQRRKCSSSSFSCNNVAVANEVRFQSVMCDCHCITCSYRTPGNSSRSIEDSALPSNVLAALLTETDEATEEATADDIIEEEDDPPRVTTSPTAAGVCPYRSQAVAAGAAPPAMSVSSVGGGASVVLQQTLVSNASFPAAMAEEEECIRVSSVGPCPRYGHSLTEFSPGHFLLFGGTDGTTLHNDLFVLIRGQRALSAAASPCCPPRVGRSSWTELRPLVAAPQPRFGHSCHLHHDKKQLIFFGGTDHVSWFNDMYSLPLLETGISRTFEKIESPPGVTEDDVPCARRGHTLVPYKDGACILFGGHSRVSLNDAWVLEADLTWRELPTRGNNPTYPFSGTPECRYGHTSVIYREHMYVFGGFGASGPAEPHVWALNLETYIWAVVDVAVGVSDGPGGRFGHTASLVGCRMVIFGGMDGFPQGKSLNDAYQLNLVTLEWTKLLVGGGSDGTESGGGGDEAATSGSVQALLGPQARRSHAAVLDSSGGRVIIFGGWGDCAVQHDNTFLEMEISPPTLREIARDWIGSKVVFPRSASSMSATPKQQQERPNNQHATCDT